MMKRIIIPLLTALFFVTACGDDSANTEITEPLDQIDEAIEEATEDPAEEMAGESAILIQGNSAGEFMIGMDIPTTSDQFEIVEEEVTYEAEGEVYNEPVYMINDHGETLAELHLTYDHETDTYGSTIGEMMLFSDRFETAEGIGVGNTISEFTAAYPDYKIWYAYVGDIYVVETPSINAQFLLDKSGVVNQPEAAGEMMDMTVEDFDAETTITKVRML